MLTAARSVQGSFGEMLTPAALSLVNTTFIEPEERPRIFGVYGAVAGGGGAIGLLLGGALTESLSGCRCMYVNLFFAAAALLGARRLLTDQRSLTKLRLDLPGVAVVVSGLFGVVYGFAEAENVGWLRAGTLTYLGVGLVLLVGFIFGQARTDHPPLALPAI
jgi:MFS family permease